MIYIISKMCTVIFKSRNHLNSMNERMKCDSNKEKKKEGSKENASKLCLQATKAVP